MSIQQYDYKSLVQAYLDAHRPHYIHDDFRQFYTQRLKKLEEAFNIRFDQNSALKMLFNATVASYWSITTPGDSFLEGSLVIISLEKCGEAGHRVFQERDQIVEYSKQNRELHLRMLYELFVCMFGEVPKTVTVADLQALGFDEANAPRIADYDDYF